MEQNQNNSASPLCRVTPLEQGVTEISARRDVPKIRSKRGTYFGYTPFGRH